MAAKKGAHKGAQRREARREGLSKLVLASPPPTPPFACKHACKRERALTVGGRGRGGGLSGGHEGEARRGGREGEGTKKREGGQTAETETGGQGKVLAVGMSVWHIGDMESGWEKMTAWEKTMVRERRAAAAVSDVIPMSTVNKGLEEY